MCHLHFSHPAPSEAGSGIIVCCFFPYFRRDAGNPPSRQSLGCFPPGWCEVVLGVFG